MKLLIALCLTLLSAPAFAQDLEWSINPEPFLSVGYRLDGGPTNSSDGVVGLKFDWLTVGSDSTVGFLAPGFNYQFSGGFSPSISAITITSRTNYMITLGDYYPIVEPGIKGGSFGFSLGYKF